MFGYINDGDVFFKVILIFKLIYLIIDLIFSKYKFFVVFKYVLFFNVING